MRVVTSVLVLRILRGADTDKFAVLYAKANPLIDRGAHRDLSQLVARLNRGRGPESSESGLDRSTWQPKRAAILNLRAGE
jgi:hypothetical protein